MTTPTFETIRSTIFETNLDTHFIIVSLRNGKKYAIMEMSKERPLFLQDATDPEKPRIIGYKPLDEYMKCHGEGESDLISIEVVPFKN